MQIVSVDLFVVPPHSEAAFRKESDTVRNIVGKIPGLVEGFFYEKMGGDTEYNFMTMAVWENEEAFADAGKAIWPRFKRKDLILRKHTRSSG